MDVIRNSFMKTNLYSTYFICSSANRQNEINCCLIQNLKNIYINSVNIFIESSALNLFNQTINNLDTIYKNKLNLIIKDQIPTYKNWLETSQSKNEISIFTNSDIYFDESINKCFDYIQNGNNLICLSRYENTKDGAVLHKHPHWSQDAWIINSNSIQKIDFLHKLDFSLGKCRCDNKLAFYFAINGWNIYNPCYNIKCYHEHASNIRNYSKKNPEIFGSIAMIHPTISKDPSIIDICIMPKTNTTINKCYLSTFLYE